MTACPTSGTRGLKVKFKVYHWWYICMERLKSRFTSKYSHSSRIVYGKLLVYGELLV